MKNLAFQKLDNSSMCFAFYSRNGRKPFLVGLIANIFLVLPLMGSEYLPGEGLSIPNSQTQDSSQLKDCIPLRHSEALYYHTFRNSLHNSRTVFTTEKHGRVAFLGGSITAGNGWRDSICLFLEETFPETHFDFINAGIPSMGSTPGAFRFSRDVTANGRVDLLFVEAAVNDRVNGFSPREQILGMEGIVRHARRSNPAMDILVLHFVDPHKMTDYREGKVPVEIRNHEKVADHYQLSTINLAKEVTVRIDSGEFTWKNDFVDLHPSPFGQHVYFRSMQYFLRKCWPDPGKPGLSGKNHPLPEKLDEACYDQGILIPATRVEDGKGWAREKNWIPNDKVNTRPDFVNVPLLTREKPGGKLKFTFTGNTVGIAVASGPDAGMIRYRIDKGEWQKIDLYTQWSSRLHLPFFFTLGHDLEPGKHTLEIRVLKDKNPHSIGNACRVRYFCTNEGI